MRALLDVNVLIALLDAAHLHHNAAMAWLVQHAGRGSDARAPAPAVGARS